MTTTSETTALDLAARIVRDGYSPTPSEVEHVAQTLIANQEELAERRDLADLVSDADISALPPELLAVRQRWIAERHAKEVAEIEADLDARWEPSTRAGVVGVAIVRCRYCSFEVFPYADAAIQDHMKACRPEIRP